jgi:hypothetical protein
VRRAAPGPQLSVGRLRVDAAKAIAKLREYQLADRTAWILEAIRAAVAANATRIELRGDANDVWLSWEGAAWPADDLPKLFDELVSPEPATERHHVRLLAAAVNSALGMNPAYVDVFAIGPDGTVRARYTPDVLDEPTAELEESALRKVVAEPAEPPVGISPRSGMLVHLRRRASLGMVTYLFWEREPPELALARAACRDIVIPLHIGDQVLDRVRGEHDIARVLLGDGLDGFVAILDPRVSGWSDHTATMQVAERGVVLATYEVELGLGTLRPPVPLRLYVDAPRMPTNASRSQVRRESHPIAAAEQRAPALLVKLIDELAAQLATESSDRARDAALALLAATAGGPRWTSGVFAIGEPLQRLAALPLVRDATGKPRILAREWRHFVYTGSAPLPDDLEPWLADVLWAPPGDPTARLLAGAFIDSGGMRARIRWARRQRRAHRRFFEHKPRTPTVTARTPPRVRARLGAALDGSCAPQRAFDQLTGEVCLYPERDHGELVLLLEGRELERLRVDSVIGFEAVIDAPHIVPGDRYRGVARDLEFTRVVTAARLGVLRCLEALAISLAGSELPAGYELTPFGVRDDEARIIRAALTLAPELGAPVHAPLSTAQVWRTSEGTWVSLVFIRTHSTIGIAAPHSNVRAPQGRLVIEGDLMLQDLLAKLAPGIRIVRYDRFRAAPAEPEWMVSQLLGSNHWALGLREGDVTGAIAPSPTSSLVLFHMGTKLEERPYMPRLVAGCTIAIDSDAIVPHPDWRAAADDAGLPARDYLAWETALVRAAARALTGDRPLELGGAGEVELDNELGRALCDALGGGYSQALEIMPTGEIGAPVRDSVDPSTLLGAELRARLCAAPILRVLGDPNLVSIEWLAKRFPPPKAIPFVGSTAAAAPIEGFTPLVAEPWLANAVARLADRVVVDGTNELEIRRRSALRMARIATHRTQPQRELASPLGSEFATIDPKANPLGVRGFVGVGTAQLELDIFVEGRPFMHLVRPQELPLRGVVELDMRHTDATFEGFSDLVQNQLLTVVRMMVPQLVLAIAKTRPQAISELGPVRSLLAAWLERQPIGQKNRESLCGVVAFTTVQGDRVSLEQASHPLNAVSTASWDGEWLKPLAGEPSTSIEHDVIRVPEVAGELHLVIEKLSRAKLVDVTADVDKLQASRRMARGLIPMPSLPNVPTELKRRLADLGDLGKSFGHGEIGLVEEPHSTGLLHERGVLRQQVKLDVFPAIRIAIEAPDLIDRDAPAGIEQVGSIANQLRALGLDTSSTREDTLGEQLRRLREGSKTPVTAHALSTRTQELALRLVRVVLRDLAHDAVPHGIRRSLRRAVLAKRLDGAELAGVPVFETVDGRWLEWPAVAQQIAKFGNVWAVTATAIDSRPLADERIVLRLDADELELARVSKLALIDGSEELALDAQTRLNRARPKATSLALESRGLLAQIALDGDGVTVCRGVVGVLAPAAAEQRGVFAHRAMHPFARVPDPCAWPTITVIDDARFEPDRTWAMPVPSGHAWVAMTARIRVASERALATVAQPPHDALVVERIDQAYDELVAVRGKTMLVRGALWLIGEPRVLFAPEIQIRDQHGDRWFAPAHDIGLGGTLFIDAPAGSFHQMTLEEVCAAAHAKLVRRLVGNPSVPQDLIAAHVAHALALQRILVGDAGSTKFECFRPQPLDATTVATMLGGKATQQVVGVGEDPDRPGLVEDGSAVSRVLIAWLGTRVRRGGLPRIALPAIPQPRSRPDPEPPHAIQIVVDHVELRLSKLGVTLGKNPPVIASRSEPILKHDNALYFAGDNPRLHAIANALLARSPWAQVAVDALVAHAVTVLNAALTEVTDASETAALQGLLLEG